MRYRHDKGKWEAKKSIGGKKHYLGAHETQKAAAKAVSDFEKKMGVV